MTNGPFRPTSKMCPETDQPNGSQIRKTSETTDLLFLPSNSLAQSSQRKKNANLDF